MIHGSKMCTIPMAQSIMERKEYLQAESDISEQNYEF